MKGFVREDTYLSLCGLNCGLCPMRLGNYCGGCGVDNQSCKLARCSLTKGHVQHCFQCMAYPCEKYEQVDAYDSFITHRRQKADMEKARAIGPEAYQQEQKEKVAILNELLVNYNDGRRKTFFCVAVNLLELPELREALAGIRENPDLPGWTDKEKSRYAVEALQRIADGRGLELKLRKKP